MEMLMATYLVGINFVSFTMHTGDKAISKGWLPFLGRIPGAYMCGVVMYYRVADCSN